MNVKPMYVAILPDGTILPGGSTADSAVKAMEREGVPVEGTQVDDIGPAYRSNPEGGTGMPSNIRGALMLAGLPQGLSYEEVMSISPKEAVERLYPIFQHLRAEELYWTGEMKTLKTGQVVKEMRQLLVSDKKPAWAKVAWAENQKPGEYAAELMGDNSKLVKGTTTRTSDFSLTTDKDGRLLGLNLYPADKLSTAFVARYPDHPISQIVTGIKTRGQVPATVDTVPTGKGLVVETLPTGLDRDQKARLVAAFSRKTFTLCAGSSGACRGSCLVYTGQNTASVKNDWKKAACAFALIADPAAYIRLIALAVENGAKAAARSRQMFFVRMNLLSDIPWEYMIPWFFQMFDGQGGRPFVQFYDYTKVYGRTPASLGVRNYDLTFSFSGTNADKVQRVLYGQQGRAAVVFVGFKLEDGSYVRVSKPKGEAGYGYGLPASTDVFAPENLKGKPEGAVLVVNADKHDARPLDPPNSLRDGPCIAGLVWKDAAGGATMTAAQKLAARVALQTVDKFVTYTELVEGTGNFKVLDERGRVFRKNGKKVVGFLIAPETPRQTHVGAEGASLLPGV
jgi:hypothetical protein